MRSLMAHKALVLKDAFLQKSIMYYILQIVVKEIVIQIPRCIDLSARIYLTG